MGFASSHLQVRTRIQSVPTLVLGDDNDQSNEIKTFSQKLKRIPWKTVLINQGQALFFNLFSSIEE